MWLNVIFLFLVWENLCALEMIIGNRFESACSNSHQALIKKTAFTRKQTYTDHCTLIVYSLPTPRKFQEQECPPSPEPTRKEKDKTGCHCVIVWVGFITVTHAATLYHPTHSAWHHILSGWLTAAFSTCMTSDSFFWDTLTRNCCPQDITMDNWQCQILTPLYLQL